MKNKIFTRIFALLFCASLVATSLDSVVYADSAVESSQAEQTPEQSGDSIPAGENAIEKSAEEEKESNSETTEADKKNESDTKDGSVLSTESDEKGGTEVAGTETNDTESETEKGTEKDTETEEATEADKTAKGAIDYEALKSQIDALPTAEALKSGEADVTKATEDFGAFVDKLYGYKLINEEAENFALIAEATEELGEERVTKLQELSAYFTGSVEATADPVSVENKTANLRFSIEPVVESSTNYDGSSATENVYYEEYPKLVVSILDAETSSYICYNVETPSGSGTVSAVYEDGKICDKSNALSYGGGFYRVNDANVMIDSIECQIEKAGHYSVKAYAGSEWETLAEFDITPLSTFVTDVYVDEEYGVLACACNKWFNSSGQEVYALVSDTKTKENWNLSGVWDSTSAATVTLYLKTQGIGNPNDYWDPLFTYVTYNGDEAQPLKHFGYDYDTYYDTYVVTLANVNSESAIKAYAPLGGEGGEHSRIINGMITSEQDPFTVKEDGTVQCNIPWVKNHGEIRVCDVTHETGASVPKITPTEVLKTIINDRKIITTDDLLNYYANGYDINISFDIENWASTGESFCSSDVQKKVKDVVETELGGQYTVGEYFGSLTLLKSVCKIIDTQTEEGIGKELGNITKLGKEITIELPLVKDLSTSEYVDNDKINLINDDSSKTRTYKVIRVQQDSSSALTTDVLDATYDEANQQITIKNDKFDYSSKGDYMRTTLVVVYKDVEKITNVTAPTYVSSFQNMYTASTVLKSCNTELGQTAEITLGSGKKVTVPVIWSVDNYQPSAAAQNSFTWTIDPNSLKNYDTNDVETSGTVKIGNIDYENVSQGKPTALKSLAYVSRPSAPDTFQETYTAENVLNSEELAKITTLSLEDTSHNRTTVYVSVAWTMKDGTTYDEKQGVSNEFTWKITDDVSSCYWDVKLGSYTRTTDDKTIRNKVSDSSSGGSGDNSGGNTGGGSGTSSGTTGDVIGNIDTTTGGADDITGDTTGGTGNKPNGKKPGTTDNKNDKNKDDKNGNNGSDSDGGTNGENGDNAGGTSGGNGGNASGNGNSGSANNGSGSGTSSGTVTIIDYKDISAETKTQISSAVEKILKLDGNIKTGDYIKSDSEDISFEIPKDILKDGRSYYLVTAAEDGNAKILQNESTEDGMFSATGEADTTYQIIYEEGVPLASMIAEDGTLMDDAEETSSYWYWGIPIIILVGIVVVLFLRKKFEK